MSRKIFINLCVNDVVAATSFYESIGANKNGMFSNTATACMVFSDTIFVMIHNPSRFKDFVPPSKEIADPQKVSEVLLCLSVDKREEVDKIVSLAVQAGGKADPSKLPEAEGMYGRSFEDLDGHVWELYWLDMEAHGKGAEKSEGK